MNDCVKLKAVADRLLIFTPIERDKLLAEKTLDSRLLRQAQDRLGRK